MINEKFNFIVEKEKSLPSEESSSTVVQFTFFARRLIDLIFKIDKIKTEKIDKIKVKIF